MVMMNFNKHLPSCSVMFNFIIDLSFFANNRASVDNLSIFQFNPRYTSHFWTTSDLTAPVKFVPLLERSKNTELATMTAGVTGVAPTVAK